MKITYRDSIDIWRQHINNPDVQLGLQRLRYRKSPERSPSYRFCQRIVDFVIRPPEVVLGDD